jgi:hypothetical protein
MDDNVKGTYSQLLTAEEEAIPTSQVKLEHAYVKDDKLIIIDPLDKELINEHIKNRTFRFIFQFQIVEGGVILYAIFHTNCWCLTKEVYEYFVANPFTIEYLWYLLKEGKFYIGFSRRPNYNIIQNVFDYAHDEYDEIRLHYSDVKNDVWRSINWDLFAKIRKIL